MANGCCMSYLSFNLSKTFCHEIVFTNHLAISTLSKSVSNTLLHLKTKEQKKKRKEKTKQKSMHKNGNDIHYPFLVNFTSQRGSPLVCNCSPAKWFQGSANGHAELQED